MTEMIFAGGFFVGIFFTLGVLALIDLRWSKSRKAKKKRSAHHLDIQRYFQSQG